MFNQGFLEDKISDNVKSIFNTFKQHFNALRDMNEQNFIFAIKDLKLILKINNVNEILLNDGKEFKRFVTNILDNTKFIKIVLIAEERSTDNFWM